MKNAVNIFKLLGDETRYKIVCDLYRSDSYVELLSERLGLTAGTVCFHLKKLEAAGIVKCSRSQFYIIYSLNKELFSVTLESFLNTNPDIENNDEKYRKKVLASFFEGGRLLSIPVQEKKRAIILSKIMDDFTKDTYTEKEVNQIIMLYYDDFCTLRRWLISDGFMSRENGVYTVLKRM